MEAKEKIQRSREYWDIVKGIGILSVVLGHSCWFAEKFVYLYHLVLFFFVSGYLYSEKKYGDSPFALFAARLKGVWLRFSVCSVLLVLLHNVFAELQILLDPQPYGLGDMIWGVFHALLLGRSEQFAGPLWFVPVLILASTLFGACVWFGRWTEKNLSFLFRNPARGKHGAILCASVFLGLLGVVLNLRGISLTYEAQTALLVVPIYTAAYYLRNTGREVQQVLKPWLAGLLLLGMFGVLALGWEIELSKQQIIGPVRFYLVSFGGIYVCLYGAKLLQKGKLLRRYFAWIGHYSFEIMALYIAVIKLVDAAYAALTGEKDPQVYGAWVCAYSRECWLLYALLGTVLPALGGWLVTRGAAKARAFLAKKAEAGQKV